MQKIILSFAIIFLFFFGLTKPYPVVAQTFGFNVHHLAADSPDNIKNILNYLSINCQTTIVRFWGYESLGGLLNIQKVLDNAPAGMQFIIALEDFPYGPAEINPKAWFESGYKNSYRSYVQQVVSKYKGNPKILIWEIMNEPHCKGDNSCTPVLVNFMKDISNLIKSIDPSTMVAPGLMGLGNIGEEFGGGYDQITSLPNINANSCHFYDGNTSGCQTAMSITKSSGKYFYVGEAGYDYGCTGADCTNVCGEDVLINRAALVQSNLNQLGGINAFLLWQFSPPQSLTLQCDKFSVFPNDPICQLDGSLDYNPPPMPGEFACNLNNPGDQTSRPSKNDEVCELCNQTPKMVPDCATDFQVSSQVQFEKHEGDFCPVDNQYWLEKSWGGTITLNLADTIIPFVGKKAKENEQYYLADYFEGTYPYYQTGPQTPYNLMSPEQQRQAFMEGGVWRKLATRDQQDALKIKMINRAVASKNGVITEGVIRDYEVILNDGINPPITKKLTEFVGHYPPADEIKRSEWEKTDDFGKLWFKVPMFTREDTKGTVIPYLGRMPKDQFTITDMTKTIEKVPHVARLYEVSRAINQILLPAARQALQANSGATNLVALQKPNTSQPNRISTTPQTKLLASNAVLLAEGPCPECPIPSIVNLSISNGMVNWSLQVCHSCQGHGQIGDVSMGACGGQKNYHTVFPPCGTFTDSGLFPPVPISCPGTATICASIKPDRDTDCNGQEIPTSCTVTVDAACKVTNSSCGPAPPVPVCGGPFSAQPVATCQKDAETGSGDTVCCGPISANLQAVDRVLNDEYMVCEECIYIPDPVDPTAPPILLNPWCDDCHDIVTRPVQRRLGVTLVHPYLGEIWKDTTDSINGFINAWKMADQPAFAPDEAKGTIRYSFSGGSISPNTGDFYYPYLGGIFNAKNWLVGILLTKDQQQ